LQEHNAVGDLLFGQVHVHRLVAAFLINGLQGFTRGLDVGQRAVRAQVGVDGALDVAGLQHGIAPHDVLVDVDAAALGGGGPGRCSAGFGRRRGLRPRRVDSGGQDECLRRAAQYGAQRAARTFEIMHSDALGSLCEIRPAYRPLPSRALRDNPVTVFARPLALTASACY